MGIGWALTGIVVIAAVMLFLIPDTPEAAAQTGCSGTITMTVIVGDLTVADGEDCTLRLSHVMGNVFTGDGSQFNAWSSNVDGDVVLGPNSGMRWGNSTIGGMLDATAGNNTVRSFGNNATGGCLCATNFNVIRSHNPAGTDFLGSLQLQNGYLVNLKDQNISGDALIQGTTGPASLTFSFIDGNLTFDSNVGPVYRSVGNYVTGNTVYTGNATTGGPGFPFPGWAAANYGEGGCDAINSADPVVSTLGLLISLYEGLIENDCQNWADPASPPF